MFCYHGEVIDYTYYRSHKNTNDCVLFLHGWGGNKHSFDASINILKATQNVLAITLPTISPTNQIWDMFDFANCVYCLIKNLNIASIKIVCHSFGFRVVTILNLIAKNDKNFNIKKMVATGGAGLKKFNLFKKIDKNNTICLLKHKKNEFLLEKIKKLDYFGLSHTNKQTFKNVVNLNTKNMINFSFPILLFWGKFDKETPIWIAHEIIKKNKHQTRIYVANSDHFAYLKQNAIFNNFLVNFL